MKLTFDTVEQTIPLKEKLRKDIEKKGYFLFESEGISKNESGEFSIFERIVLHEKANLPLNQIENEIQKLMNTKIPYYKFLKEEKNFNVFFIVYSNDCSFFWIFTLENNSIKFIKSFDDFRALAAWLELYTPKKEFNKPFGKPYLKCIDKGLREYGVPYPGNFDGLIFERNSLRPKLLLEFSKVNYTTLEKHKINLQGTLGDKFFREDKNRWSIFLKFTEVLNAPNRIVWWYTKREEYMLGEVNHTKSKDGVAILTGAIYYDELIDYILKIIQND